LDSTLEKYSFGEARHPEICEYFDDVPEYICEKTVVLRTLNTVGAEFHPPTYPVRKMSDGKRHAITACCRSQALKNLDSSGDSQMRDSALLEVDAVLDVGTEVTDAETLEEIPRCVYVIDDEIQVLEVIEMQLLAAGYTVQAFSRAAGFLAVADELPAGIVISDQRMPEMDGLHLQVQLQNWAQKFPLIILSGYPDTRVAVQAMKQGAVSVLDKPYNKEQLLNSIEEAFVTLDRSAIDEGRLPPFLMNGSFYKDRLSGRESQVIALVYAGKTNKSIGITLGISIKTVEKHRGKAMKKMEVNSLAELVRLIDRERGQH